MLHKYFGDLAAGASTERYQTVDELPKDLPIKIEAEYKEFLEDLWKNYSDAPLVLEEQKLRSLMTEDDREGIEKAYKDAKRVTLWEKITKSNHEDVIHYRGLLIEYTKDLLLVMRHDFLEEITGKHINCKAFED